MRFLLALLVFGIYFFFARWYFVCEVRNHCGEVEVNLPSRANTLTLMDGDSVLLYDYNEFSFPKNSYQADLNDNNLEFIAQVAKYLRENPEKELTITGRYLSSEADVKTGFFENLGQARAAEIEKLLEEQGIDQKRINIDHEMAEGDVLTQPLAFHARTKAIPDDYDGLQYRFEDMTYSDANFKFNSAIFEPKEAFKFYADSLKTFLAEHPDYELKIIGHTDTIASQAYNYELGIKRAKNAQKYLEENGIETSFEIESKGREQPIAPNMNPDGTKNEEGMQRNRRVNFKLEQTVKQ